MSFSEETLQVRIAQQDVDHAGGGKCPPCGGSIAGLFLLVAFTVFRLPPWLPLFAIESKGVDPSWQMLLNEAAGNDWVFGRDLFFTYGPFGFIHARMYHPETWEILVAAWLGVSVIMADLVWRVTGRGRLSFIGRTLCGIAMLEFMSRDTMAVCFSIHALVFLDVVVPQRNDAKTQSIAESLHPFAPSRLYADSIVGTLRVFRQAVPILLLAALPWAKFSYFVTVAFVACTLVAIGILQKRIPWRAVLLFAACPLAWLMSGATLAECGQFIGTGFQLAGGYSAAMGLGPESAAGMVVLVSAGLVVLLLPIWLASRLRLNDWRLSILTMLFFHGLLFIAWKSCFVRYHAERLPIFLGTVIPLLVSGWIIFAQRERPMCATGSASASTVEPVNSRKHWQSQWHTFLMRLRAVEVRWSFPALLATVVGLVSAGAIDRVRLSTIGEVVHHSLAPLRDQVLAVAESVNDPDWRRSTHEAQLQKIREAYPIPNLDGSVDVFPSKLIVGFAHGLAMRPRPILQSYAAFTPELIERDVQHFRSADAPDHLLISVDEIDNRLPTMEDSRAWFELLSSYDLTNSSGDFLKLSHLGRPRLSIPPEPSDRVDGKFGQPIAVPSGLAWCRIKVEATAIGRLASILYRLPALRLRTVMAGSTASEHDFRLLPGSADAGFLLSPLVENRDDLIHLWQSVDDSRRSSVGVDDRMCVRSCVVTLEPGCELLFKPELTIEFFDVARTVGNRLDSASVDKLATLIDAPR